MHKLRVFAAIVESGSMTAAGRALGLSRSVVSAHLKQLEADLGARLLERTTRSMSVTALGEEVYAAARRMLDAARAALDAADAHLGSVRGEVRVAAPVDLGRAVLAPVIERLRRAHPGLRLRVLLGDRKVDLVRDGVDLALRIGFPKESSLILRRLAQTDEILVAAPSLVGTGASLKDLSALPRVAHSLVDAPSWSLTHLDGRTESVTWPPSVVAVDSSDLVRRLVVRGLGWSVLPELLVTDALRSGALVRVAPEWAWRRVDVFALMPSRAVSPPRRAVLAALEDRLAEIMEDAA